MSGISPLNSMISNAVRMQTVRRDFTMSQEVKDKLIADLQHRNDGIVATSETQSDGATKGNAVGASASGEGASGGGTGGSTASFGSKGTIVSKLA